VENLTEHLRKLKASNRVVHAALQGLHTLGESVYETNPKGDSSQSLNQLDKNIRQAHKYLQTLGIMDPW
jgi:mevalonate kinase